MNRRELVVIGGGAAGLAAAHEAVRLGRRPLLISDGPLGGDCTHTGCVPSKTLIEASRQGVGFSAAMQRVRDTVDRIAATEDETVLRSRGVEVVRGHAKFVGPLRLEVDGIGAIEADAAVIATGAVPAVPGWPGASECELLTSETVFGLRTRPDSLALIGGGPIGVELAQAFAGFGIRVTLVEAAPRLLLEEEPEASVVVARALAAAGVAVRTGAGVDEVRRTAGGVTVIARGVPDLEADCVLVATGRVPSTRSLDLAAAGVQTDEHGYVVTDDRLRTSAEGVFAAGDVTGRLPFTHAADEMGRIAAKNALGRRASSTFEADAVPWAIFTDPEVARVGATEAEAASRGGRVAFVPMTEVDRGRVGGREEGFVKLIAGPKALTRRAFGGRVIGATIVAPAAGEMIHEVALAMRTGMFTGRLAQTVHAYPTWSVAIRQAAGQFFREVDGRRAQRARGDTGHDR